jgi:hypothetical protein
VLQDPVLRALADSRLRAILRLVRDTALSSGDIATHFPEVAGLANLATPAHAPPKSARYPNGALARAACTALAPRD